MSASEIISRARLRSGLTQGGLAQLAGTSRPTLSAYEHGRKSPTLETAARIVGEAGFDLSLDPRITFVERSVGRGRFVLVPTTLPRLSVEAALRVVALPLRVNWSDPGRRFDLRDRRQRARLYEAVIREGTPEDVLAFIDGVLLVDLWDELVLPAATRAAWESALPTLAEAGDRGE